MTTRATGGNSSAQWCTLYPWFWTGKRSRWLSWILQEWGTSQVRQEGGREGLSVLYLPLSPPPPLSAGQAVWVPGDEEGVVFIGWNNRPRKLGFVYCICRK